MKKNFKVSKLFLTVLSVLIALIFVTPVIWSLAVSFQREGKQITNIWETTRVLSFTVTSPPGC